MTDELRSKHENLKTLVTALEYNHGRSMSGVKSAHTAYRNQLQQVKKLCDTLRKLTLENQKALPTKRRGKVKVAEIDDEVPEVPEEDEGIDAEPVHYQSDDEVEPEPVVVKKKRGRPKKK